MPLVTTTEMFKKAYDGGYAIGAFNVNNMEIVQAITEAAGELNSPTVLQQHMFVYSLKAFYIAAYKLFYF